MDHDDYDYESVDLGFVENGVWRYAGGPEFPVR